MRRHAIHCVLSDRISAKVIRYVLSAASCDQKKCGEGQTARLTKLCSLLLQPAEADAVLFLVCLSGSVTEDRLGTSLGCDGR